ncbi:MAG: Ig-like domain-containing protein [Bacteroidales bacterium]|nr:Ig-like domain-containing protein [Bacteroidales bacterium]
MKKILFILAFLAVVASCGKEKTDKKGGKDNSIKSVVLSKNLMMIGAGVEYRLAAACEPARDNAEWEWISDNPAVATVSETGLVTSKKAGETVIRARLEAKEDTCRLVVCALPEAVDLGIAGVKWASFNIGADSGEGVGSPFTWGSTLPNELDKKTPYLVYLRDEMDHPYQRLTKYCPNADYGYEGYVDQRTSLEAEDDAATQIFGVGWRMPAKNDFNQLLDNCTWTWVSSKNCFKISNKKDSGKYIYLPITGHTDPSFSQEKGYYWTSDLETGHPLGAYYYEIQHVSGSANGDIHSPMTAVRYAKYFIRAVKTKDYYE